MSRSPLSLPSSSTLHLAAGESSCRSAAGSIHLYDSKPNKMRMGIDPQVLNSTIKHRSQQTGTAGACPGLGPWGLAGDWLW